MSYPRATEANQNAILGNQSAPFRVEVHVQNVEAKTKLQGVSRLPPVDWELISRRVTPKRRPCRLQTAECRQTVQTDRADHADRVPFFLTLGSLFSILQFQNSVQYVLMFVIYPQAAPLKLNIRLLIQSEKRV